VEVITNKTKKRPSLAREESINFLPTFLHSIKEKEDHRREREREKEREKEKREKRKRKARESNRQTRRERH